MTIGIILCKKKKDSLVEITLPEGANIHASKYQLYLPDKEELKKQLEDAQRDWEVQQENAIIKCKFICYSNGAKSIFREEKRFDLEIHLVNTE